MKGCHLCVGSMPTFSNAVGPNITLATESFDLYLLIRNFLITFLKHQIKRFGFNDNEVYTSYNLGRQSFFVKSTKGLCFTVHFCLLFICVITPKVRNMSF